MVLSTAGLFLLAGAQFLAAGTVIVYAGAIVVTFLFVIMLAQMEGRAPYDRAARSPFLATVSSFLIFWAVLYSLILVKPSSAPVAAEGTSGAFATSYDPRLLTTEHLVADSEARGLTPSVEVIGRAVRSTASLVDGESGQMKPHVAGLGETLYTDHLITVELAGALLFVALVGAVAIATPRRPVRPGAAS